MRNLFLSAPLLLVACAATPPSTPVHGVTPGHKCHTAGTEAFIGKTEGSTVGSAIKKASNAAVLRWAPPGVMLTMDFREDRVTVHYGPDKKITDIRCG
jgi:hypothetical protein